MYIDTHLDTMYQSLRNDRIFSEKSDNGHIDLHRSREAGLFVGFFTGFPTSSRYETEKMMRDWLEYYIFSDANITQIRTVNDLETHKQQFENTSSSERSIGAVLHFEGAAGIDTELNKLYIYHGLGLRSMSLTWNEENQFATGVGDGDPNRGLTSEGKDLLDAMEALGIMIDVSHLNDKSFWEVSDHTNMPIFASHSNLRSRCGHKRNLTDQMVQTIADSGGTIGVNFCKGFLNDDKDHASIMDAVEMIGSIIEQVGIDHVHIGSDFDGCTLPDDMSDVSVMPKLFDKIQEKYFLNNDDMEKIQYGNMIRMMKAYWS